MSDTTPPVIVTSSATFSGPAGAVVPAGGQVSLEIEVTGTSLVPKVTLFNGAGTATTDSTQSPYTFTYTIQAGNSGPIIYTVEAEDEAGNKAVASLKDVARSAGALIKASLGSQIRTIALMALDAVCSGICDINTAPVTISSPAFGGSAGPLIGIGAEVNVTFTVKGTSLVPTVTLFNGARAASTSNTASPYTFTYTLQAGDNGPVVYMVQATNQAAFVTSAAFVDSGRTAGTLFCVNIGCSASVDTYAPSLAPDTCAL